jgi:hypothetical protein
MSESTSIPEFSPEDLAWFKDTYGSTEWMAYVHGQDECFDRRNDSGPLFTEDTIRKYVADMGKWNQESVAWGLEPTPVTVFRFGEPYALEADRCGTEWLVFSHEHSAWWKPARRGYTDRTSQAGRYTEAEAREICERAAYRWHRGAGGPKALPPEVMVRADAPDMLAAISEATEATIATRGTVDTGTAEPIRLEVVLRKAAD